MTVEHEDIRTAMDILGGPSEMARIWGLNVRLAGRYFSGNRDLPPKRLTQLIEALHAHSKRANELADRLSKGLE